MPRRIIHPYSTARHLELDAEQNTLNMKIEAIKTAISKQDDTSLTTLLGLDRIYVENQQELELIQVGTEWRINHFNGMPHPDPVYNIYPTGRILHEYSSRPLIEAIYIEQPTAFNSILSELCASSPQLQDTFMAAWNKILKEQKKETDLPARLFTWNSGDANKARAELSKMESYGKKLVQQGEKNKDTLAKDKGGLVEKLSGDANKEIDSFEKQQQKQAKEHTVSDFQNQVDIARFKLKLVKQLHSDDSKLSIHRDAEWKHDLFNAVIGFLTVGFAHGIHYAVTGNVSFFSRTDSQKWVDRSHEALDSSIKLNLRG